MPEPDVYDDFKRAAVNDKLREFVISVVGEDQIKHVLNAVGIAIKQTTDENIERIKELFAAEFGRELEFTFDDGRPAFRGATEEKK